MGHKQVSIFIAGFIPQVPAMVEVEPDQSQGLSCGWQRPRTHISRVLEVGLDLGLKPKHFNMDVSISCIVLPHPTHLLLALQRKYLMHLVSAGDTWLSSPDGVWERYILILLLSQRQDTRRAVFTPDAPPVSLGWMWGRI